MSATGKLVPGNSRETEAIRATQNSKVPMSCAAEVRTLPAAFSLVEPMKHPGSQTPTASYTYTFGLAPVSCGDHDMDG